MLEYRPAEAEQYAAFLQLMRCHMADYLERTMALLEMTSEQFSHLFGTVGQVCGIYEDGQLAGFCWIEERETVLHFHGLVLKEAFRGRGIGTQVLHDLEARHGEGMATIELGVHESNRRAKKLYERLGYQTVRMLEELGFEVMQKELA